MYPAGTTPTSGTGTSATFTTVQGGTVVVQFETRATVSDPPWDSGPLAARTNPFKVISAAVKEVDFTSDYAAFYTYNTDFAGVNSTTFSPRGWRANPPANNPITHVQGQRISASVTIQVLPSGVTFNLIGTGSSGATSFAANNLLATGADQVVTVTANSALPAQVDVISSSIQWQVQVGSLTCSAGTSGPHTIYVVWGTPSGTATLKRINWVCNLAKGGNSFASIGNKVGPDATGGSRFGSHSIFSDLTDAWQVMDGYKGDCGTLSTLMKQELDLLGATGAAVRFVYACHADWSHLYSSSTVANETDGNGNILGMWFGSGLGAGWNNYEGCCVFQSKWWEGGNGVGVSSAYQVLLDSTSPNTNAGSHQCWSSNTGAAVAYPPGTP